MNNKFIKFISSLLILSFLVAAFSVFSFAQENTEDDSGSGEILSDLLVFYNRTFEEGWDYTNGFTKYSAGSNSITVDHEEDVLGYYNYFVRFEATTKNASSAYVDFKKDAVLEKENAPTTIVEFSVKADDVAYLGKIVWMIMGKSGAANVSLLDINSKGEAVVFNGTSGGNLNLGVLGNEWINIAYIFDWSQENMECTVKYGFGLNAGYSEEKKLSMPYPPDSMGMQNLYVGLPASTGRTAATEAESLGMSYCLDNLKVYQGVDKPMYIDPAIYGYGAGVNNQAEKVVDIQEKAGVKSKAQILEEALAMKLGVDYALARNVRYPLVNNTENESYSGVYGAPKKQDGNVLVPLQLLLDYIGFPSYIHPDNMSFDITTGTSTTYITIGRDSATVDGNRVALSLAPGYLKNSAGEDYLVIALEDIPVLFPGWLAIYDDMGLVIVYEDTTPENLDDNAPLVDRSEDLDVMVDIMKRFVFDTVTADKLADGYVANGQLVYEDTKANTNNFTHPYIMANADVFAALKAKYALTSGKEGYDATLNSYIKSIIEEADAIYSEYANVSAGAYAGIKTDKVPVNVNASGDGYDTRGKMTELVGYANLLPTLAFAYQITADSNYAKLAYDISAALAEWSHWGPGYFTHCAEVTMAYSIAYDWLYNAYKSLSLDTEVLAAAIYNLGVHDGYVSSSGKACEHARGLGDLSKYNTSTGSTNAVGTAGMIVGSLAILDYIGSENAPETAYSETMYLIGNNIQSLLTYGLDIYAPDGSYIESATYWEYATSNFFRMVMALESAAGKSYGFMDTWGIDRTCYYAIHIEDSDGLIWNYHDDYIEIVSKFGQDELATLNTDMFNFVGSYFGDETLIAVRAQQIADGKSVTIYDLLFYPFDGVKAEPKLELDYHMEAIEGFVSRSDWSDGAIYTGLMGGKNNVDHGHIDSGNFIYRSNGIAWIVDLGTDNPYIDGYDQAGTRYKLYRVTGEGQNVIIETNNAASLAYGQQSGYGGVIMDTLSNEHGSYVTLDNTAVYAGTATYAHRGVFFTNDRKTVVLQDEFTFVKVQTLAWVLHTKASVSVEDNGRTVYLTETDAKGEERTLRLSLVSLRPDFQFNVRNTSETLLTSTIKSVSGEPQYDREDYTRITIECETISFDVAVVFELIDDYRNPPPVAYEWTEMSEWVPAAPKEGGDEEEVVETRPEYETSEIRKMVSSIEAILKKDTAYVDRLDALYKLLADVKYIENTKGTNDIYKQPAIADAYADYLDCVDEYEAFLEYAGGAFSLADKLSLAVAGLRVAEVEDAEE